MNKTDGRVLQGRYRLISVLAEGGMGVVYRAERVGLSRPVVVKFLQAVLADRPGIVDRFEREARATARLNHPNCVALIDFGIDQQAPFLVMEYVEGKTLSEVLQQGPLEPMRSINVARQILAGLAHAHERGIVHRDLKPANVMIVDAVGSDDFVKILDFGLAKLLHGDQRDVTVEGIAIGTPGYMSPEQAAGLPSDQSADIYCTGALLYHLLTGVKPFDGDDIRSILRQHREETPIPPRQRALPTPISPELEAVVLKAMEREAERRFQTAEAMAEALLSTPEGQAQKGRATRAARPSGRTRAEVVRRPSRTRRGKGAWLAWGMLLGMGGVLFLVVYYPSVRKRLDQVGRVVAAAPAHHVAPPRAAPSPSPSAPPADDRDENGAEEESAPLEAKENDGSGEDDRAAPPEVAVPHRDVSQVRTVSDVKALLRKGDTEGALAALYHLRRLKPPPTTLKSAEIAVLIGNLYFERRWLTDALKEYRFAIKTAARVRTDATLINNTVRALGERTTYWRARRLVLEYVGRAAVGSLRRAVKNPNPLLRKRAQAVLLALH